MSGRLRPHFLEGRLGDANLVSLRRRRGAPRDRPSRVGEEPRAGPQGAGAGSVGQSRARSLRSGRELQAGEEGPIVRLDTGAGSRGGRRVARHETGTVKSERVRTRGAEAEGGRPGGEDPVTIGRSPAPSRGPDDPVHQDVFPRRRLPTPRTWRSDPNLTPTLPLSTSHFLVSTGNLKEGRAKPVHLRYSHIARVFGSRKVCLFTTALRRS